jgi:hypothetical protein
MGFAALNPSFAHPTDAMNYGPPKVVPVSAIAPLRGEVVFGNVRAELRRGAAQRRALTLYLLPDGVSRPANINRG